MLELAAKGDQEAFGDFVDATATKATILVRAMGYENAEATLVACYAEAWHRLGEYTAGKLSPQAWLLALVYTSLKRT